MMMLGGRRTDAFEGGQGRALGSVIRMDGRFAGLSLFVEEVVTSRIPLTSKTWRTRGVVLLLILSGYGMGFETKPIGRATVVPVFIGYKLPTGRFSYVLGRLLAPFYVRWCVSRNVWGVGQHFRAEPGTPCAS